MALELAIDVANRFQSDIILIWARREKLLFNDEQLSTMTNLAEDKLQALCDKYQPSMKYGKLRWQITNGKVAPALSTTATRELASMIIIGTNGASGFEQYWMGSQAVRIVRDSPCPVLINANSRQKVPPAASMAKIFDSEVRILGLLDMKEDESALRTYVQQSVDYLEKEGIRYQTEIRPYSNYCDTVMDYCDDIKADLVVINTEQDRIISQIFLGTNAQQIVHRSQIPVLCIHPADYINVAAKV